MLLDPAGFVALGGATDAADLPTTEDAVSRSRKGATDAYIAIVDPTGGGVPYFSYLGGSGADTLNGMSLGPGGNLYITGQTASADFPVTEGAYQSRMAGAPDGYLVRLSQDRRRIEYATYLGGSQPDGGTAPAAGPPEDWQPR